MKQTLGPIATKIDFTLITLSLLLTLPSLGHAGTTIPLDPEELEFLHLIKS